MASRFQAFSGDDLEDTLDSVLSVPGAFGNIVVAAVKQMKVWDAAAMLLVGASLLWLLVGYLISGDHDCEVRGAGGSGDRRLAGLRHGRRG